MARPEAGTEVWLGWHTTDQSGKLTCSFSRTGGTMLLTAQGAKAQTVHNAFVIRNGE